VIELPEDPMQFARAIRDCPWFERLSLSEEDRWRGALYAAQRERAELERSVTSKEDFYRSLEQVCEIAPVNESTIARVAQLTQKTNQFNLTTKRYTEQQIAEMTECPGWSVWSLRVKDRYQDNGLVGVAISRVQDGVCEIDSFLMSCRVIGRTVETALLARIAADAKEKGAVELQGLFIPTRKNVPAAGFYRDHGFTEEANGLWKIDLREKRIDLPQWITLKEPA
jgi:FkbH-like protein